MSLDSEEAHHQRAEIKHPQIRCLDQLGSLREDLDFVQHESVSVVVIVNVNLSRKSLWTTDQSLDSFTVDSVVKLTLFSDSPVQLCLKLLVTALGVDSYVALNSCLSLALLDFEE